MPTTPRQASYAEQLRQLLPPGKLWNLSPGSKLRKLFQGFADEFARVHDRFDALVEETDPRTATETISEWENMLGIVPVSGASLAERRAAISQKYVARGGGTEAYFLQVLAALGVSATFSYYKVARSGRLRSGDRIYGPQWAYAVKITLPASLLTDGGAVAGDPCGTACGPTGSPYLEQLLRSALPAHVAAIFVYA